MQATQSVAITLTERAARQARRMQQDNPENSGKALRIFVEGACCSGLEYGLIFDAFQPGDSQAEFHGMPVVVDPESLRHLQGAIVDYSETEGNSGFTVSNPGARAQCDCGHS
jgi:iron-sulfur cluster assembly accessory protein